MAVFDDYRVRWLVMGLVVSTITSAFFFSSGLDGRWPAIGIAAEPPISQHRKFVRDTSQDPPEWKSRCAKLERLPFHEDHVFLRATLQLFCEGFELINGPPKSYLRKTKLFDAHTSANCSAPFASLYSPRRDATAAVPIVENSCTLCELLRGFKAARGLIQQPFVLVDLMTHNYGRLSGGYNYMCADDHALPLTRRRATVKACRLAVGLRQQCPDVAIADLLAFLEWPYLRRAFVGQDAIMVRANPAAGDEWAPHPKVEVLPLGMGLDFKPVWPFAEVFDIFEAIARTPRDELIISRMSSFGIRSLVKEQLQLAHPNASQQQSYGVDYRTDLASAVFIASPPGFGADCYRHYEALAMGAIPVANAHSVSLTALRTLPSLVVDDFAQADRATLDAAHAQFRARARTTSARSMMRALTRQYWVERIQAAASVPVLPHEVVQVRVRLEDDDDGGAARNRTFAALTGDSDLCDCPCQCGMCGSDANDSDPPRHVWERSECLKGQDIDWPNR